MPFTHLNRDFAAGLLGKLARCAPEFRETTN